MTVEPVRLRLDPAPARAVGTTVSILSAWLPVEHLRLGGGTALEARWHHRASQDLDFSFSPGTGRSGSLFLKDFDGIRMDLRALARDGVVAMDSVVMVGTNHVQFMVGDVPVSFVGTDRFHGDPRDEVECQTGVILGSTRDILTKKMYNRLGVNRLATERDAYDFAVARTLAPTDLAYAWSTLTDDMKRNTLAAYRDLAEGENQPRPLALVKPRFERIARQVWQQVLWMMESDLEYVPPLTQGDEDVGDRGEHGH
ncbi:MAG: nucleotidyl transferase AbiEii/AbiGii toxin family protein [Gammaproteobacteria bacterium]|nr:nucleotidyl transferase AbiEii/AbiGii toxin family protein [Gammaproteobacteria bacterium]